LEAVPFAITLLGLQGPAWGELNTQRVRGAALASFDRKRLTRKAPPLTAKAVAFLEQGVESFETGAERVLAGDVCFLVHARLRCGDAARIACEPTLDLADGRGYLEVDAAGGDTKTGGSRRKRRTALPVAAGANGLTGSWGAAWLKARRQEGLNAAADGCLFLALDGTGRFTRELRSTAAMSAIMRELLRSAGVPEAEKYTSHGCKATCLSWAAKFGLKHGSRRLLGGHAKPKDLSMLEYSRDAIAPALRELRTVYDAVHDGSFDPDVTRSGRFTSGGPASSAAGPAQAPRHPAAPAGSADVVCSSSSSSSSSEDPYLEEEAGTPQEALADAAAVRANFMDLDVDVFKLWRKAEEQERLVQHPRWATFHVSKKQGGRVPLCSRVENEAAKVHVKAVFKPGCARCLRCTRRWAKEVCVGLA